MVISFLLLLFMCEATVQPTLALDRAPTDKYKHPVMRLDFMCLLWVCFSFAPRPQAFVYWTCLCTKWEDVFFVQKRIKIRYYYEGYMLEVYIMGWHILFEIKQKQPIKPFSSVISCSLVQVILIYSALSFSPLKLLAHGCPLQRPPQTRCTWP